MKSQPKNQFLSIMLLLFLFSACTERNPEITGTYINHAESEFSIADDTLIVEHTDKNNYLIHRKTGYNLISENGELGELKLETEQWKAVFDEGSQNMTENRKGRVISFDPEKGLLMLEDSEYQRIDQ